jgi:hypothetical protein
MMSEVCNHDDHRSARNTRQMMTVALDEHHSHLPRRRRALLYLLCKAYLQAAIAIVTVRPNAGDQMSPGEAFVLPRGDDDLRSGSSI